MIRNYNTIRSILSEPWLLSEEEAGRLGFLISEVLSPVRAEESDERRELASVSFFQEVALGGESSRTARVGVLRITGALTKYDSLCDYGMESYGTMLREMDADPGVKAVVLYIDSPGGTVSGTEELGNVISGMSKPVVCFGSDMLCSAAYWLGACCREIIMNNTTATVGSIGVLTTIVDMSGYYERQGIRIRDILAPQSAHKREIDEQLRNGKDDLIRARLSVVADKFQTVVRSKRNRVDESQLTGKVYFAGDVVGTLIDGIGSFEEAVARAVSLANDHQTNHDNTMSQRQFPALAQAAGVPSLESADGTIFLTAEMAAAVEQALGSAAASPGEQPPAANREVEQATESPSAQESDHSLEERLAQLEHRLSSMESESGDPGAAVRPQTDGTKDDVTAASNFTEAMAAAARFKEMYND